MRVLPLLLLSAPAFPHALDKEAAAVIDLFYNLEFEKAMAAAEALSRRHPDHPIGPFYRSIVFYQRFLSEDPRRQETLDAFERESAAAVAAAEILERFRPAEGLYFLGAAKGFRARVLAAQRKYLRAIPEALSAVRHLEKAVAIEPEFTDAYLGLGMYHYFTARLPAGAKPFAYLVGVRGSREKGLDYLRRAASGPGPARWEALSMLSAVHTLESDWEQADAILKELMERYPRNPLYRMRRTYVALRAGWWERALSHADPQGDWLGLIPEDLKPLAQSFARYRTAEVYLITGRAAQAEPLITALEASARPPSLEDWIALRRANLLDARGRHREAAALYRGLKHRRAAKIGREFLKVPYPLGPKDVMPWLGVETPK